MSPLCHSCMLNRGQLEGINTLLEIISSTECQEVCGCGGHGQLYTLHFLFISLSILLFLFPTSKYKPDSILGSVFILLFYLDSVRIVTFVLMENKQTKQQQLTGKEYTEESEERFILAHSFKGFQSTMAEKVRWSSLIHSSVSMGQKIAHLSQGQEVENKNQAPGISFKCLFPYPQGLASAS